MRNQIFYEDHFVTQAVDPDLKAANKKGQEDVKAQVAEGEKTNAPASKPEEGFSEKNAEAGSKTPFPQGTALN